MGLLSPKSQAHYTHVTQPARQRIKSPLDNMQL